MSRQRKNQLNNIAEFITALSFLSLPGKSLEYSQLATIGLLGSSPVARLLGTFLA